MSFTHSGGDASSSPRPVASNLSTESNVIPRGHKNQVIRRREHIEKRGNTGQKGRRKTQSFCVWVSKNSWVGLDSHQLGLSSHTTQLSAAFAVWHTLESLGLLFRARSVLCCLDIRLNAIRSGPVPVLSHWHCWCAVLCCAVLCCVLHNVQLLCAVPLNTEERDCNLHIRCEMSFCDVEFLLQTKKS